MTDVDAKALIEEMRSVKMLLILHLLAMGYKQKDIAGAINVSEATLSRMLPKGVSRDVPRKAARDI